MMILLFVVIFLLYDSQNRHKERGGKKQTLNLIEK